MKLLHDSLYHPNSPSHDPNSTAIAFHPNFHQCQILSHELQWECNTHAHILFPPAIKFKADMLAKETKQLFEKYLSGSMDKTKAKQELIKLLNGD